MYLEEIIFGIRETKNKFKIILTYFLKEPFYEIKRLISGYYNSTLLFWVSVMVYIFLWNKQIGGYKIKIAGALIVISYFYMFYKSERWKEYYQKEFIQGKKIE